MTNIHWLNPVSADFNTAADWSTGTVPGANDTAILDAAGSTAYTVTAVVPAMSNVLVGGLQLANTATLAITGSEFAVFGTTVNAGTIDIADGAAFYASGSTDNAGTIALESTGALTGLVVDFSTTLTGGGTISLGDNSENVILSQGKDLTFTNADNTIVGSGSVIGNVHKFVMTNEAGGVIDADNKTPLNINVRSLTNNAGLIETTGNGHLVIGRVDNTGTLETNGGVLTVGGVSGASGSAVISAGTIDFKGAFSQNVNFTGNSGKLILAESQQYGASITGFSLTGKTSLDLRDIGFVSSTEATFSGTATSGVLTVTNGTHTAHIT